MIRLIGCLEQGELADLFRAERAGDRAVVKLFHPATSDAAYAAVAARTAQALGAVAHRGVAHVIDIGLVRGRLAIVLEDVGSLPLSHFLKESCDRGTHVPSAVVVGLVLDVLEVLGAAHSAGVVHGALTPGNIVFNDDGQIGISEFGAIAALSASEVLRRAFEASLRKSYRAPEAPRQTTAASDIYAVGAIAYELLTLREPVAGIASPGTRSAKVPPPSALAHHVNARLDSIVMRALEPNSERRYRSCHDFAQSLRDYFASIGGLATRPRLADFWRELFGEAAPVPVLGPVPFEEEFSLGDLSGARTPVELRIAAAERAPFSGGAVDDRALTSDGIPVFDEQEIVTGPGLEVHTIPEEGPSTPLEASGLDQQLLTTSDLSADWVAPAAQAPPAENPGPESAPDGRRIRVVQALGVQALGDGGVDSVADQAADDPPSAQSTAKTLTTFVLPFKNVGEPAMPNWSAMRQRSVRQSRTVALVGTVVLVSAVAGLTVGWLRSMSDPQAELVSYLPQPIARALPSPAQVRPIAPRGEVATCYAAPKRRRAYLEVPSGRGVLVEIDGRPVCEEGRRIAVEPGQRQVRIVDIKTDRVFVTTERFEVGRIVRMQPQFQ